MKLDQLTIYEEHILLKNLETKGINVYSVLKEVETFDIPEVLNFLDIVTKYLKILEELKE